MKLRRILEYRYYILNQKKKHQKRSVSCPHFHRVIFFQKIKKISIVYNHFNVPISAAVWIYLGISYVTVSICFFWLGRISPAQWENRLPCVEGLPFKYNVECQMNCE